jgi:hypothetical protein
MSSPACQQPSDRLPVPNLSVLQAKRAPPSQAGSPNAPAHPSAAPQPLAELHLHINELASMQQQMVATLNLDPGGKAHCAVLPEPPLLEASSVPPERISALLGRQLMQVGWAASALAALGAALALCHPNPRPLLPVLDPSAAEGPAIAAPPSHIV